MAAKEAAEAVVEYKQEVPLTQFSPSVTGNFVKLV